LEFSAHFSLFTNASRSRAVSRPTSADALRAFQVPLRSESMGGADGIMVEVDAAGSGFDRDTLADLDSISGELTPLLSVTPTSTQS
jgi:hypothetical protein